MNPYGGLYHREDEWNTLRQAYETRHQRHLVMSVGPAGIGKTTLIEKCLRPAVQEDQGFFVQGRFDEVDHPEPFSPWISVAEQLIDALQQRTGTGCSQEQLAAVIKAIEQHIEGSDLAAFVTLVPGLGKMMNMEPPNDSAKIPMAVTGRFNFMMIFAGFLRGVASVDRPIVCFLDNVHNADASALEVLKLLVADVHISNILPVIALRPISPEHPTSTFLQELEASEIALVPVIPTSIPEQAIQYWLETSYNNMDLTDTQQRSRICSTIANGCQGNALAIHLCLHLMKLNREDVETGGIPPLDLGGDAYSLLGLLMRRLSIDGRAVCMAAACIGNAVDIPLLTQVVGNGDIHEGLKEAERHGVLQFCRQDGACGEIQDMHAGYYRFANPCYRRILYNMLHPQQRMTYHQAIAKHFSDDKANATVFRVVVHMALAGDRLPPEAKESLVAYCVQAGRLSSQWSALVLAAKYLQLGFSQLKYCRPGFWKVEASLITDLYCATAEVDVLLGQPIENDELLEIAKHQAKNPADRLKVAKVRIQVLIAQSQYQEAIDIGVKSLMKNGEVIRKNASFSTEFRTVRIHLESNPNIASLATMVDPKAVATMEVMNILISCAMVHQAALVPLLACRMVKLTYECGLAGSSPFALSLLGAILCLEGTAIELGTQCTDIGLKMVDALFDRSSRGRVMTIHWGVSGRFMKPWSMCQEPMKIAYRHCIRACDAEFGMLCPVISTLNMFAAGVDELKAISQAMGSVYKLLHSNEHDALQRILRPYYQVILHLRGVSPEVDPTVLTGAIMTEEDDMRFIEEHPNPTIECSLLWCRAWISFQMHRFGKARMLLDRCQALLREGPQLMLASVQVCLEYVSATTCARLLWKFKRQQNKLSTDEMKRRIYLESSIQSSLSVLQSLVRHCEANAQPHALMVQGEWEALNDQVDIAKDCFQKAIECCEASYSLADKAMFCEQAGLTLRVCFEEDNALDYLEDSCASYRAWGALIKVNHIKSNIIPGAESDEKATD